MKYKEYAMRWDKFVFGKNFGDGYGGIYRNEKWIQEIISPIIQSIRQCVYKTPIFLADIGCGSGIVGLNALKELNSDNIFLHSIDVNIKQLEGIHTEARALGITGNYQAVVSNLFDVAYPDNFFHGIVGRLFPHHLTLADNNRFWRFIVNKLEFRGIASIYDIVAPDKTIASFIRKVYEWRAEKVGVEPQGFISTKKYILEKLTAIKGIDYKIYEEARGPLYVSGIASIQEKMGLENSEMADLEKIFQSASNKIKKICRIKNVPNRDLSSENLLSTHSFYWPCQLTIVKKR